MTTTSAIHAVAELAASQHSVFTRRQAADLNLTAHRVATALAQGWLNEPYPGVLVVGGAPRTFQSASDGGDMAAGGHGAASHRAAARCIGSTVSLVRDDRGERRPHPSLVAEPARCLYGCRHTTSSLDECDLVDVDGIRTTNLARTLADLGSVVRDRRLVGRALTERVDVARVWTGYETAERLHRPGQRGTGCCFGSRCDPVRRPCCRRAGSKSCSPAASGSDGCRRSCRSTRSSTIRSFVARVDLAIASVKLGLEAHSRRFHFGPELRTRDEQRELRALLLAGSCCISGGTAAKRPTEVLRPSSKLSPPAAGSSGRREPSEREPRS